MKNILDRDEQMRLEGTHKAALSVSGTSGKHAALREVCLTAMADGIAVSTCPDEHVHLELFDKNEKIIAVLILEPEQALEVAKTITNAADKALGVS